MKKLTIRISDDKCKMLSDHAAKRGVSLARVIREELGDTVARPGYTTFTITQGQDKGTTFDISNADLDKAWELGKETMAITHSGQQALAQGTEITWPHKISFIKALREITGLGLLEAKNVSEQVNFGPFFTGCG